MIRDKFRKTVEILSNSYYLLAVRLILGGLLILAAVTKLPAPLKFVEAVSSYGLLPPVLAEAYGLTLPWVELVVGVGLVMGIFCRFFAATSILMVISFIIANGTAVYENEYCPCFGGMVYLVKTSDALVIDMAMVLLAAIILRFGSGKLSLLNILSRRNRE